MLHAYKHPSAMFPVIAMHHGMRDISQPVVLLEHGVEAGGLDALQKKLALDPERTLVVPRAPAHGFSVEELSLRTELGEPSTRQTFVPSSEQRSLGEVRIQDESAGRDIAEQLQKLSRPLEMVEKAAAKDGIEAAVTADVPDVVAHEREIGKGHTTLDVVARGDIGLADLDADHLEPHPSKSNGVAAFEAAKIGYAERALVARKDQLKHASRGSEYVVLADLYALVWLRQCSIVKAYVVSGESDIHKQKEYVVLTSHATDYL